MTALNIGMKDALSLWSELEQAWHRTNGFGTDTAEVYAYRVVRESPGSLYPRNTPLWREHQADYAKEVAENLSVILALFAEQRQCKIEVDGRPFDPKVGVEPFTHRVHIGVTPNERPQERP